jgi:hypothetical protein
MSIFSQHLDGPQEAYRKVFAAAARSAYNLYDDTKRRTYMKAKNWKELCALTLVGDGVLTAINPKRHLNLWTFGPMACVRAVDALTRRPTLTRGLGVAAAAAGIWWASRQKPAPRTLLFMRRGA